MQLAPSLHRIGSDLVNVYLIEDDAGVTIVDAGLPGQYDELEPELASMGRSLAEVRAILLTHGDTDHIGFAERLRREHGVPVLVHELEQAGGLHRYEIRSGGEVLSRGDFSAVEPDGRYWIRGSLPVAANLDYVTVRVEDAATRARSYTLPIGKLHAE